MVAPAVRPPRPGGVAGLCPSPAVGGIEVTSTKAGWLSLDPVTGRTSTDAAHAHNTPLTSVGMYLPAGAADGVLGHTDRVAADARPVEVVEAAGIEPASASTPPLALHA